MHRCLRKLQVEMSELHNKFKNHTSKNIVFDDYAHDVFLQQKAALEMEIKQSMNAAERPQSVKASINRKE
ncbi:hypothetical protein A0U40_09770 [[Bacillus] sp. KCTC 13219]|nr:hypothetical protein A0U40_09770 [[Bacillus] sp. KCTC 13219]